jgi:hypothetical protein
LEPDRCAGIAGVDPHFDAAAIPPWLCPHLLLRPSHLPLGRVRCREQPVAPMTDLEGPHGQLQGLPCHLRGEAATAPGFALATRRERFEDRPRSPPFAFRFSVVADVELLHV